MKTYNIKEVDEILNDPKLLPAITKYEYLVTHLDKIDDVFVCNFCSLFKMTPHSFTNAPEDFDFNEYNKKYFNYLKKLNKNPNISFEEAYKNVNSFSFREELSFSSKMYHLVHPEYPIWDSILTNKKHFGTFKKTRDKVNDYFTYKDLYDKYVNSPQGDLITKRFIKKFKYSIIKPVKQIDFVLWRDR